MACRASPNVEGQIAAGEAGSETAEQQVGVGIGRLVTALSITGGTRLRAG
jgi:hypothetical protein